MADLDATDRRIIRQLTRDGRQSALAVAEAVGLSPTPCMRRIKRLEANGVILGYTARIDPSALGLNLCVMVTVQLARQGPDAHRQFLDAIERCPEITECLLVTGSVDYLLRVWVADIAALRGFITDALQAIPCVGETSTMLVLRQTETMLAPLR